MGLKNDNGHVWGEWKMFPPLHMAGKEWTDSFVLITNRSDESEPEDRDTVERDALLLAQTYTSQETKVNTPHLNKKYRTYLPADTVLQ